MASMFSQRFGGRRRPSLFKVREFSNIEEDHDDEGEEMENNENKRPPLQTSESENTREVKKKVHGSIGGRRRSSLFGILSMSEFSKFVDRFQAEDQVQDETLEEIEDEILEVLEDHKEEIEDEVLEVLEDNKDQRLRILNQQIGKSCTK